MESERESISAPVLLAGAGVVVALLIGGAAAMRDRDDAASTTASDSPPATSNLPADEGVDPTSMSDPEGASTDGVCDAAAVVDALASEMGTFDYDASDSPADLAADVDLVLTGALLSTSARGDNMASVSIKPGRVELGDGVAPSEFVLPVVDVTPLGSISEFVAFLRANSSSPGGYEVAVDGLWVACDH
ncbi:MAG: hypothetical protein ACR2P0_04410, partial [Acidimicrobiales bacterium]